jgi:hypothetical protein
LTIADWLAASCSSGFLSSCSASEALSRVLIMMILPAVATLDRQSRCSNGVLIQLL